MQSLVVISALLTAVIEFLLAFRKEKFREEGRAEVRQEVKKQEEASAARAREVLDQQRSPDVAVDRLRDGTF